MLYGVVGSPAMMGFHRVLKAAAEAGTVRYAFRHALPYGGEGGNGGEGVETAATAMTTPLQGYGVVLDVKNMEYQSFDSSDSEDEVRMFVYETGGQERCRGKGKHGREMLIDEQGTVRLDVLEAPENAMVGFYPVLLAHRTVRPRNER